MKHEQFVAKSGPIQILLHQTPAEVLSDPNLTIEEKRAVLASWSSDRFAVPGKPSLRSIPGLSKPLKVADILEALRQLDDDDPPPRGGVAATAARYRVTKATSVQPGVALPPETMEQLVAAHQNNIHRYCRLLATQLTEIERNYIHHRIAEATREMDQLLVQLNPKTATRDTGPAGVGRKNHDRQPAAPTCSVTAP